MSPLPWTWWQFGDNPMDNTWLFLLGVGLCKVPGSQECFPSPLVTSGLWGGQSSFCPLPSSVPQSQLGVWILQLPPLSRARAWGKRRFPSALGAGLILQLKSPAVPPPWRGTGTFCKRSEVPVPAARSQHGSVWFLTSPASPLPSASAPP